MQHFKLFQVNVTDSNAVYIVSYASVLSDKLLLTVFMFPASYELVASRTLHADSAMHALLSIVVSISNNFFY
jgi:hypothetical protein